MNSTVERAARCSYGDGESPSCLCPSSMASRVVRRSSSAAASFVGRMATLATPIEQYQGEQAEAAATPWGVGQRREGCCQFARTARQATRACFRDLRSKARRHVAMRPAGCPAPRGMWVVALVSRTEIVYTAARYPQGGQCLLYSLGADNR